MTPQSTPLPAARSAVRHNPTKHGALQMLIGECAHGENLNAAHVNTILGPRDGPVGAAWAAALAAPTLGHVPFIAVLQPSIAVKPFTLFVTKVTLDAVEHQNLTWGAAQAGVAAGVADTVADGSISAQQCDTDVIIASVWVNPCANDADSVYGNNREATATALRNSITRSPSLERMLEARHRVFNGLYPEPT